LFREFRKYRHHLFQLNRKVNVTDLIYNKNKTQ
jgi:hypothetical protein